MFLSGCSRTNTLRFPNGTTVLVKSYAIAVSDTGSVATQENGAYRINIPDDSLLCRCDTVRYIEPDVALYKPIFGRIDQVVINSRNPQVTELYRFEKRAVLLAGYVTADSVHPYTRFEPPLIILSKPGITSDTTISQMIISDQTGHSTGENVKVKSIVIHKQSGRFIIDGIPEECHLYELTITRDAVVTFGGQDLIVPEAVVLHSNLLYTKDRGLIAEWGLRVRPKSQANVPGQPEMETYLEFNHYSNSN
jgi:hypothetical protein